MEKNPYEYLRPVTGQNFVDRNDLVEEICSEFSFQGGASYAIVGGRRFGKSSLLSAIQQRAKKTTEYNNVLYLSVDFNQKFLSPQSFYSHVLREFVLVVLSRFPEMSRIKNISSDLSKEIEYQDLLEKIQDLLERLPPETRVGLLLDEADSLLSNSWYGDLFDQLRTLVSSSPIMNSVSLLLAGSYFYYKTKSLGSPLINTLRPMFLRCIDEDSICALAALNKNGEDKIAHDVWVYSGGHPHLAQYIFYNLWKIEGVEKNNSIDQIEKIAKKYQKEHSPNLYNWVETCGDDGRRIYDFLSKTKGWLNEDVIARKTKIAATRAKQALVTLCFHGLAFENQDTACEYRVQGNLFKNWFIQNREDLINKNIISNMKLSEKHDFNIEHLEIVENKIQANGIKGNIEQKTGLSANEVTKLFKGIYTQVDSRPKTSVKNKKIIKDTVKEIGKDLSSSKPDENILRSRLENLQKIAPDILDVVLATVMSPVSGFTLVAKKIAEKIKKDVVDK